MVKFENGLPVLEAFFYLHNPPNPQKLVLEYHKLNREIFFWRTKFQQEIDFVETFDGKVLGFEFKWNPKQKVSFPASFVESYKAETKVIHRDNFREFVMV